MWARVEDAGAVREYAVDMWSKMCIKLSTTGFARV